MGDLTDGGDSQNEAITSPVDMYHRWQKASQYPKRKAVI